MNEGNDTTNDMTDGGRTDQVLSLLSQLPVSEEMTAEPSDGDAEHRDDAGGDIDPSPGATKAGRSKSRGVNRGDDGRFASGARGISDPDPDGDPTDTSDDDAPVGQSNSKMMLERAKRAREASELRSKVRDLERTVEEARSSVPDLSGMTRMDAVRWALGRWLGVDVKDPAVAAEVDEIVVDALDGRIDESALKAEELGELRRQRHERKRLEEDRRWKRDMQDRLTRADQERRQAEVRAYESATVRQADEWLSDKSEAYPFLTANPEGPAGEVLAKMALQAVREGHVQIRTVEDEQAVWARLAAAADRYWQQAAERLAVKLNGKTGSTTRNDDRSDTPPGRRASAGARKDGQRDGARGTPRTTTAAGGGGRGRPQERAVRQEVEETVGPMGFNDIHDVINSGMRRELGARSGGRVGRR